MPSRSPQMTSFSRGLRHSAPILLVVGPFGMLFGVVATEAGLTLTETLSFSFLAFAGAAQFTALQLMAENAPTLIVLATSLAVNLRLAMYSAALAPHLGAASASKRAVIAFFLVDHTYADSAREYDNRPQMTLDEKIAYFAGSAIAVCPAWYAATWLGAALGQAIPPEFALDFAMPITFIAVVAPMLRTPAHLSAAAVSVAAALALAWMPYSTGLLLAGLLAMLTGASVETLQERFRADGKDRP